MGNSIGVPNEFLDYCNRLRRLNFHPERSLRGYTYADIRQISGCGYSEVSQGHIPDAFLQTITVLRSGTNLGYPLTGMNDWFIKPSVAPWHCPQQNKRAEQVVLHVV
jgi:hypothetical protein